MKSTTALAALIGIAFAVASASSALAQSSAPGGSPPPRTKLKVVQPPPPPPGGPDNRTTQSRPPKPIIAATPAKPAPKPIDDISGGDNTSAGTYTCNQSGYVQACDDVKILEKHCPGGMTSDEGGSVTCNY